jgi:hypothetical protein
VFAAYRNVREVRDLPEVEGWQDAEAARSSKR